MRRTSPALLGDARVPHENTPTVPGSTRSRSPVTGTLDRKIRQRTDPKTDKSRRTVPLTPQAMEALQVHQVRQNLEGTQGSDDLVFTSARGTALYDSNIRKHWHRVSANLGFPRCRGTTCATLRRRSCLPKVSPSRLCPVCSVMRPSASPPTSMAMCRRRPTGRPQTPCPRLCDESYEPVTRKRGEPSDDAFPDAGPSALRPFCYVRRHVRKCSQVDSHTGYV